MHVALQPVNIQADCSSHVKGSQIRTTSMKGDEFPVCLSVWFSGKGE